MDTMFAYLAHPIDLAGQSSWLGSMLGDLNALLVKCKVGAFRPGMSYLANTSDPKHVRYINELNNVAIHQADALIAVLSSEIPTLGTPVEISFALSCRKPVLILTDISASVQLAAWAEQGAVVVDMSHPDFTWPTPEQMSVYLTRAYVAQKERPTWQPDVTAQDGPPPLLVLKDGAANLKPGKYRGDAGIDLAITHPESLEPGEYRLLGTGVHVAIPDGWFGLVTGRSSTWAKHRCRTQPGVIDSGYRGELMVGLKNESAGRVGWEAGTRLGQLILLPTFGGSVETVDTLPEHERGLNGYGSSGS
jgi:dUTP pyrophosphatase